MQPYFFPYIGYWQLINAVDIYVIYDDANYIKGGWINRNRILVNGVPKFINIKIKNASSFKAINLTEVSYDEQFNGKLLKTIKESYSKALYFREVYNMIEKIVNHNETHLVKYLMKSIIEINKYLGIETEIILSSQIPKNDESKGQQKVIDICKSLKADHYINAIGGQSIYSREDFKENKIKLSFLKPFAITYPQFKNEEFFSNLSIIDVMMHNSPEEIKEMLSLYTLIDSE